MAVTIIDAPCGAGKTEYAIAYMNAHPENSFIFITPYLKEIERIKQGTKVAFYDPKNYQRPDLLGGDFRLKSKLDDFNHLLAQGKDIATTHATFTAATQETINILEDNSYHLIIDEAVDVLTPLNDIVDSPKNRVNGGSSIHNITHNKPVEISFGDTNITATSDKAPVIAKYVERITEKNVNEIARILRVTL